MHTHTHPPTHTESWYILNVITKMLGQEHNMSENNDLIEVSAQACGQKFYKPKFVIVSIKVELIRFPSLSHPHTLTGKGSCLHL